VTVEVQVPQKLSAPAIDALQKYAEATSEIDVRSELKSKAEL
jgi:hypothetical protein